MKSATNREGSETVDELIPKGTKVVHAFSGVYESVNIGVGLLSVILATYFFLENQARYTSVAKIAITLSGIHGGLSFAMLIILPKARDAIFIVNRSDSMKKLTAVVALGSVPLVLFEY